MSVVGGLAPRLFGSHFEAVGWCPRAGEDCGTVCLGSFDGVHVTLPVTFVGVDTDTHDVIAHSVRSPQQVHLFLGIDVSPLSVHSAASESVYFLEFRFGVEAYAGRALCAERYASREGRYIQEGNHSFHVSFVLKFTGLNPWFVRFS